MSLRIREIELRNVMRDEARVASVKHNAISANPSRDTGISRALSAINHSRINTPRINYYASNNGVKNRIELSLPAASMTRFSGIGNVIDLSQT